MRLPTVPLLRMHPRKTAPWQGSLTCGETIEEARIMRDIVRKHPLFGPMCIDDDGAKGVTVGRNGPIIISRRAPSNTNDIVDRDTRTTMTAVGEWEEGDEKTVSYRYWTGPLIRERVMRRNFWHLSKALISLQIKLFPTNRDCILCCYFNIISIVEHERKINFYFV